MEPQEDYSLLLRAKETFLENEEPGFDPKTYCFKEQLEFIEDKAYYATAVCSVRAGKTIACAVDLITTALKRERVVCLYITLARANAKRIIWPELLHLNQEFNLGGRVNETELSIKFQNGSVIYASGAKDRSEIEKFRGLALALCYIDECQAFRDYIRDLVDEVIAKRLFDYAGRLRLIGTPGPVPVGYFYECSQSKEWSHHYWTMFENPWLQTKSGQSHQEILERELKRKGVSIEDPSIQRECFGKWTYDPNSLVFRYEAAKNHFEKVPEAEKWTYVFGIDLGFEDADAIAVIGWNEASPTAYLVEERIKNKQGITELALEIEKLIHVYNPDRIIMDTGGLGKKIAEEIQRRYSLPIMAAEKVRKFEFIELLNDAMRTNRFMAKKNSRFAQDCQLVQWDKEATQLKILDSYHSDICDAVLYGFREAHHWLWEKKPVRPVVGTPDWLLEQEREMEEEALKRLRDSEEMDPWEKGL